MKVTLIGYGKFASALHKGMSQHTQDEIVISSPSLIPGESILGAQTECDNRLAVTNANVIILAVKPVVVGRVLQEITPYLAKNSVIISVAAGVSIKKMASFCPHQRIVRAMPNMPIAIQRGVIGLYGAVNEELKENISHLFSSLGLCNWLNSEEELNAITALSGSGPAYVFLFLEALVSGAVKLGLEASFAKTCAIETLIGSALLAQNTNESLSILREQVTSPGGTTQAALTHLNANNFIESIEKALKAAFDRAQELS